MVATRKKPLAAGSPSRRWLVAIIVFVVLVFVDLGLFGWLIFRSLSQREINDIILEARQEAELVADQIADEAERWDRDLVMALATHAETRTYIDSVLANREVVEMVQVLDDQKRVVYRGVRAEREGTDELDLDALELPNVVTETFEEETPFEIVEVPVGDLGTFVIGLRREEIEQRLAVLRRALLRQAGFIAALTLLLFGAAWILMRQLAVRSVRSEEKAREARELAYVGTLASGLAHEIRSPLNSLQLNMQMLEEEVDLGQRDTAGQRLLTITQSEIGRLERLVSDFLRYARPRALELEEVPAVDLLEHAVAILHGGLRASGARINVRDETDGRTVRVDREQINQLLLNLIRNAADAAGAAGRPLRLDCTVTSAGDDVLLILEDNGIGMSPEELERAVEVFYSKRRGGTGLGLAIADRIVKSHGGTLRFEPRESEGTRVLVELPGQIE